MENSRLWQVIISLHVVECKQINQWLKSPFFCRRTQPLALFQYFQTCKQTGQAPEQGKAMAAVFGSNTAANIPALRSIMTELTGQIEHFLVYSAVFDKQGEYPIRLAEAYRKRSLDKHFRQSLHAARKAWASQPYRHAEYYDAQAAIEYEQYQFLSTGQRTEALNWQELSNQTDTAFIAHKLRQACFALSHQVVYRTGYHFGLLDMVLTQVRNFSELQSIPSVGLYYYCYLFF